MMLFPYGSQWLGSVLFCCLVFSGCTIKATTDTTTDGTTEFLSSTSGQAWWTENGLVRDGQHAQAFVASNYDHLLPEMAKGEGEYLRALGAILGVTPSEQGRFCQVMQDHYAELRLVGWPQEQQTLSQFLFRIQLLKPRWVSEPAAKNHPGNPNDFMMVSLAPETNDVDSRD